MSWSEKVGAMLQKPNDDLVSKDDVPWWQKTAARLLGTVAGGVCIFIGVFQCIANMLLLQGISCILAAIWMSLLGFVTLVFEAPVCCLFFDFTSEGSKWIENRPFWNRAAFYLLGSTLPLLMCFGIWSFLACALVFLTGLLYGTMALGKKAPQEEMRNNAATVYSTNQQFPPAASSNSNLVESAQPTAMTNPFNSRA